jgi:ribosomal protein L29
MKNKEFTKKYASVNKETLVKEIRERKTKINTLMFDVTRGKIDNVREMKKTRREIARLNTLLTRNNQ